MEYYTIILVIDWLFTKIANLKLNLYDLKNNS